MLDLLILNKYYLLYVQYNIHTYVHTSTHSASYVNTYGLTNVIGIPGPAKNESLIVMIKPLSAINPKKNIIRFQLFL